jgi:type IV pilus assembly protein PilC
LTGSPYSDPVATIVLRPIPQRHEAALRGTGVFPLLLVDMVGVGEATGQLGEVLDRTARHFEEEVDAAVGALTAVVEPALVVALGVVVGGTLVAIYLPMFDLVTVLR